MKNLFETIASLFEDLLFLPYQMLTQIESVSWWLATGVRFLFITIGSIAAVYCIKQLRKFDKSGAENKDPSAHSFL